MNGLIGLGDRGGAKQSSKMDSISSVFTPVHKQLLMQPIALGEADPEGSRASPICHLPSSRVPHGAAVPMASAGSAWKRTEANRVPESIT